MQHGNKRLDIYSIWGLVNFWPFSRSLQSSFKTTRGPIAIQFSVGCTVKPWERWKGWCADGSEGWCDEPVAMAISGCSLHNPRPTRTHSAPPTCRWHLSVSSRADVWCGEKARGIEEPERLDLTARLFITCSLNNAFDFSLLHTVTDASRRHGGL